MSSTLDRHFTRYSDHAPEVPVWDITSELGGCFHRFFDTSPISPSGRFLAVTRFAPKDRMPVPGEPAEVVLFDLQKGGHRVVAETHGWDTQLGAQVQWGRDDTQLFFNDMDITAWRPFGVLMNPQTNARRRLDGTVYMVSMDGRLAISPCLLRTGRTQAGYGVLAPPNAVPSNQGAPDDDGIYITDTETGQCRLLVSLAEILQTCMEAGRYADGDLYGFHVKWNLQGTRIQFVTRWAPHDGGAMRHNLVTMNAQGDDLAVAIPDREWTAKGGHHPNWCPDGDSVMMNLRAAGRGTPMRLIRARCDGSDCSIMHPEVEGSGHPALHPDNRHVITDVYQHEPAAWADGTTPLRWIDLKTGKVRNIVRICTRPGFAGPKHERRVDPHPAWDRSWRYVAFNACPNGVRGVFLADMSGLL